MNLDFSLHLTELLISRLCHDLITPIGAVNTGLELFLETPSTHLTESKEILNLILQSAHSASNRLSFVRAAFGKSGDRLTLGNARDLLANYLENSKLTLRWEEPFQKDIPLQGGGRLLLNLGLWISECAPRGGTLHISLREKDPLAFSLLLQAESLILHQEALDALEGRSSLEDLTPRTAPCYFTYRLLEELQGNLSIFQSSPSELVVEVKEIELL